MRFGTDRPYGNGSLVLHTDARKQMAATEYLQRLVHHMPQIEIYTQKVVPEEVHPDPWPRGTWYVKVRVTKHDTWATVASGITETQARRMQDKLRTRTYEDRPIHAVKIGREVSDG